MLPNPEILATYVSKHFTDYEVATAYEAGCCGYYVHRSYESYGWRSLVVNPADIHRKGKERFTKTDKIDAQLIARELKDGRLDSIHVPEKEREELRSLFRRRNDLVKDFRRIKSIIKMQLLYFGVSIPEEFDNDHWSYKFRYWIDALKFVHPTARETLDSRMRSYFIEASWQAIRTDPIMQAYYRKHVGKNVKSVIVKVARKLLSRTLAVIKTEIPYVIGVVE